MIESKIYVRQNPMQAVRRFREWSSLFSGRLFVMLVAYGDESGTGDKTGRKQGTAEATMAGLVASVEEWAQFAYQWQGILNDYDAKYFHFREWAMASAILMGKRPACSAYLKGPYHDWDLQKLDDFALALARIIGQGNKISFGGFVSTKEVYDAKVKGKLPIGLEPYDKCLDECFIEFAKKLDIYWPNFTEHISFFWDWTDDPHWRKAIHDAYGPLKARDKRLSEISFAEKTETLPLQAADMIAYRWRQFTGKYVVGERAILNEMDKALLKTSKRSSPPGMGENVPTRRLKNLTMLRGSRMLPKGKTEK
jgi:hypothetical protein